MGWFSLGKLWLVRLVWLVQHSQNIKAVGVQVFQPERHFFWIGVGTRWVKWKLKDKGIAAALGYAEWVPPIKPAGCHCPAGMKEEDPD